MPAARLVLVGRAAGGFGVRGEIRLVAYTEDPMALLRYRTLLGEDGATLLTLASARPSRPGEIVARASQVADKDAADALRGAALYVDRATLPELAEEDDFYLADLIGLEAVAEAGERLGRVKAVVNHGAGDILEIETSDGSPTRLVAFTRDNVPVVDIPAGRLVVRLPAEIDGDTPDGESPLPDQAGGPRS